jgi:hypothetical protein
MKTWPVRIRPNMEARMKKSACLVVVAISLAVAGGVARASQPGVVLVTQMGDSLLGADGEQRALDEAIRGYLRKNPPEMLSAAICSAVEKQLPASLPETDREKALRHVRTNLTPDILKRMISAGLRRNFTVDEICVLAQYDESQLSDDMRRKDVGFRTELSREIRLLLAATIS